MNVPRLPGVTPTQALPPGARGPAWPPGATLLRRQLLRTGLALTPLALLPACGFALRQTGDYPFQKLHAGFSTSTGLGAELARQLRSTGRIVLLTEAAQAQQADVILDILQEQRQRVVVGQNVSGQVREVQLRMTVRFRLRSPQGQEWIEPQELYQQRDLSFSETAALAKEMEETMLYRDMQSDIVQQIMRRLARVKPPHER